MSRLRRFLHGRNGFDALNIALLTAIIVVNIISMGMQFIPAIRFVIAAAFGSFQLVLLAAFTVRALSRNLTARNRENLAFINGLTKVKRWLKRSLPGDSGFRFFKCPSCRHNLRVPKGKGHIFITCPQCGERFKRKT